MKYGIQTFIAYLMVGGILFAMALVGGIEGAF